MKKYGVSEFRHSVFYYCRSYSERLTLFPRLFSKHIESGIVVVFGKGLVDTEATVVA